MDYDERTVSGWRVILECSLQERYPDLLRGTLDELRCQFHQIRRSVPARALESLRAIPVWVHYRAHTRCMNYHPAERWLREHGYNPSMARAIEIGNAENFVAWTRHQPWMVLHELAHAYHDQVLGFENAAIKDAFAEAGRSGRYASVLRAGGTRERHYALANHKEYFAETSEAFFGCNDFYPFVRAELQEHDPRMFALLRELWGA
jgi:hypothetical protein